MKIALLFLDDDFICVFGDSPVVERVAVDAGGRWSATRGCWMVDRSEFALLGNALDASGVLWVAEDQGKPRQWAQWMFAELPPEVSADVYQAAVSILRQRPEHAVHLRLLELAWEERQHQTGCSAEDQ